MSSEHVQAGVIEVSAARRLSTRRSAQAAVFVVCTAALVAAALLKPDPRGLGTHERVGLPPCSFHAITGIPCPGCGMTTAFAHTVRLQFKRAFLANPFGLLVSAAAAVLGGFSLVCLITGWEAWSRLRFLERPIFVWALLGTLFASWGFKVLITVL